MVQGLLLMEHTEEEEEELEQYLEARALGRRREGRWVPTVLDT